MNREPRRGVRLREEAGDLDAANPVRTDLLDGDPAPRELLGEEVGRVAKAAAGDVAAVGGLPRAWRQPDVGIGDRGPGLQQGSRQDESGQKTS